MILSYFLAKTKILKFFPGEVRVRQNYIEKIMAYQKCFIGPLVWKCFTNDFERKLKFENFALFLHNSTSIVSILNTFWKFFNPFPGISDFLYIFYVH